MRMNKNRRERLGLYTLDMTVVWTRGSRSEPPNWRCAEVGVQYYPPPRSPVHPVTGVRTLRTECARSHMFVWSQCLYIEGEVNVDLTTIVDLKHVNRKKISNP
jgi:hypothetical protein